MYQVADAIRKVTAAMQTALETGQRSRHIDAEDLIGVLLAIADQLDPPLGGPVDQTDACPGCGEACSDQLVWQDDERVRCTSCGMEYFPGR